MTHNSIQQSEEPEYQVCLNSHRIILNIFKRNDNSSSKLRDSVLSWVVCGDRMKYSAVSDNRWCLGGLVHVLKMGVRWPWRFAGLPWESHR